MMHKNRFIITLFLACLTGIPLWAQQNLEVFWQAKRFFNPQANTSYIDVYYTLPAHQLTGNAAHALDLAGGLAVQIRTQDQTGIRGNQVYRIPLPDTSAAIIPSLTDLIRLPASTSSFFTEIDLINLGDTTKRFTRRQELLGMNQPFLSDVMLIQRQEPINASNELFARGSDAIIPKFFEYYPEEQAKLRFYQEIYPQNRFQRGLLRWSILNAEGQVVEGYSGFYRLENASSNSVIPVVAGLDIANLPTGNYVLSTLLKNEDGQDLAVSQVFFQRYKQEPLAQSTEADIEEQGDEPAEEDWVYPGGKNFAEKYDERNIRHHLAALEPIATPNENQTISGLLATGTIEQMHRYFYVFWTRRNERKPERAWMDYANELQFVERRFTNAMLRGFETDRGRMYLRYGKPNEMLEFRATEYGHHEVWWYRDLEGITNVPFVFVNRNDMADEFMMVHSGHPDELFSPTWARRLQTDTRY